MLGKDLITSVPLTVLPTDTVESSMKVMSRRRIRHLRVVDAKGNLVGLLTNRDLRPAAPSPVETDAWRPAHGEAVTVDQEMVRAPWTVGPRYSVRDAIPGVVDLHGENLRQRAQALAAPQRRDALGEAAARRFGGAR